MTRQESVTITKYKIRNAENGKEISKVIVEHFKKYYEPTKISKSVEDYAEVPMFRRVKV